MAQGMKIERMTMGDLRAVMVGRQRELESTSDPMDRKKIVQAIEKLQLRMNYINQH